MISRRSLFGWIAGLIVAPEVKDYSNGWVWGPVLSPPAPSKYFRPGLRLLEVPNRHWGSTLDDFLQNDL